MGGPTIERVSIGRRIVLPSVLWCAADPHVSQTFVWDMRAMAPSCEPLCVSCPMSDSMFRIRRAKENGSENRCDKAGRLCFSFSNASWNCCATRPSARKETLWPSWTSVRDRVGSFRRQKEDPEADRRTARSLAPHVQSIARDQIPQVRTSDVPDFPLPQLLCLPLEPPHPGEGCRMQSMPRQFRHRPPLLPATLLQ